MKYIIVPALGFATFLIVAIAASDASAHHCPDTHRDCGNVCCPK